MKRFILKETLNTLQQCFTTTIDKCLCGRSRCSSVYLRWIFDLTRRQKSGVTFLDSSRSHLSHSAHQSHCNVLPARWSQRSHLFTRSFLFKKYYWIECKADETLACLACFTSAGPCVKQDARANGSNTNVCAARSVHVARLDVCPTCPVRPRVLWFPFRSCLHDLGSRRRDDCNPRAAVFKGAALPTLPRVVCPSLPLSSRACILCSPD